MPESPLFPAWGQWSAAAPKNIYLERNVPVARADAVERNALVSQILLVVAVVIHIEVQQRQVGEYDLAA